MFHFRLKVFHTVAKRLNFTKAASELYISQPAVTKHIKAIETHYQCRLFTRIGNRIQLTTEGKLVAEYAEKILQLEHQLDSQIRQFNTVQHGILKLGASTTAAQYILPQCLAQFKALHPSIEIQLTTDNTEQIEMLLQDEKIDLGIVEGQSQRQHITYTPFLKDELVLCANINANIPELIPISALEKLSFIKREKGSGTLEITTHNLKQHCINFADLPTELILENNESIKHYLLNSSAVAFISISAITDELKAKKLKIIDIEHFEIPRYYYTISLQGEAHPLVKQFQYFLNNHN